MGTKRDTKQTGNLGETIAATFLQRKGLVILDRNYTKKFGEIDIVARETGIGGSKTHFSRETSDIVHFVEVKSVSYETRELLDWAVTHETWRPEELVHAFKLNQIRKTAEAWIGEHAWSGEVQIDVIAIRMVPREKYALIKHMPRIISE